MITGSLPSSLWLKIGTGSQLHQYSASLHWYTICLSYHYPHSLHKRTICIILIQHTYKSLVSYHPHTLSWPSPIHYVSLTVIETDPLNVLEHREHHDVQFISTHVGHVVTETVTWTESGRGSDQRGWVSLSIGSVMILGQGEGGGEGRNGEAHHFHVEHSVLLFFWSLHTPPSPPSCLLNLTDRQTFMKQANSQVVGTSVRAVIDQFNSTDVRSVVR